MLSHRRHRIYSTPAPVPFWTIITITVAFAIKITHHSHRPAIIRTIIAWTHRISQTSHFHRRKVTTARAASGRSIRPPRSCQVHRPLQALQRRPLVPQAAAYSIIKRHKHHVYTAHWMGIRRPVPHSVASDQVTVVHLLVQIFAFHRIALVDGSLVLRTVCALLSFILLSFCKFLYLWLLLFLFHSKMAISDNLFELRNETKFMRRHQTCLALPFGIFNTFASLHLMMIIMTLNHFHSVHLM